MKKLTIEEMEEKLDSEEGLHHYEVDDFARDLIVRLKAAEDLVELWHNDDTETCKCPVAWDREERNDCADALELVIKGEGS